MNLWNCLSRIRILRNSCFCGNLYASCDPNSADGRSEAERVFRNLSAVLKAAGRSFDHVARAGVFRTSMIDFVAMHGIYAKYFSQPFSARTTIAVATLPPGACVEIDSSSRLEAKHVG
jgi:enamine deaminase RidA (YjgF/YER057c/UK114 family)